MRKKKPDTRVVGVYPHASGRFRVVYMIDGKNKVEYRAQKAAAEARANELRAILGGEQVDYDGCPAKMECDGGLTRGEWLKAIWAQIQSVQEITDPVLRIQACDVISKTYKVIREDLEALEGGTAKKDDPSELSDEELHAKVLQLSELKHAAQR